MSGLGTGVGTASLVGIEAAKKDALERGYHWKDMAPPEACQLVAIRVKILASG